MSTYGHALRRNGQEMTCTAHTVWAITGGGEIRLGVVPSHQQMMRTNLILTEGMPMRGIGVVAHQLGAPSRLIFSSLDSLSTSSSTSSLANVGTAVGIFRYVGGGMGEAVLIGAQRKGMSFLFLI